MSWIEFVSREDFIMDGCCDSEANVVDCIVDPCSMRELFGEGTAVDSVSSSDIDCCFFRIISFSSRELYTDFRSVLPARSSSLPMLELRFELRRCVDISSRSPSSLRRRMNIELNFPPNFEGLVLGCIDADVCK